MACNPGFHQDDFHRFATETSYFLAQIWRPNVFDLSTAVGARVHERTWAGSHHFTNAAAPRFFLKKSKHFACILFVFMFHYL